MDGGWFLFDQATPSAAERLAGKFGNSGISDMAYMLNRQATGAIDFRIGDGTSNHTVASARTIGASAWTFIAGKFVPSTGVYVYLDGSLDGQNTSSIPVSIQNTNSPFTIGASPLPGNYLDGRMALAFLCAAAVPDALIDAFYQQTRVLFGI